MKINATEQEARTWLSEQLFAAGGVAELTLRRSFGPLFYFADRPVIDADFVSGKGMSSSQCDKQLEAFASEQTDLLGIFQNSWSQIGDLDETDANAAGTFTYQGQYYHFSERPGLLSIDDYHRVSVTQFGVIFLVAQSADLREMLSSRAEVRVLSERDANVVVCAARFVFVPAFDSESWLGAVLSA